jgi:hypothetical protein
LEARKLKNYLKRPLDVMDALRMLRSSGFSVSLPNQTADGVMFFEVEGCAITAAQILELKDMKKLDRAGIRQCGGNRIGEQSSYC